MATAPSVNPPTAVTTFNDLSATGLLDGLRRGGLDVPGDISVVGYDDIFGSDFCNPPLTTVTSPVERAGRAVIDLLIGTQVLNGLVLHDLAMPDPAFDPTDQITALVATVIRSRSVEVPS